MRIADNSLPILQGIDKASIIRRTVLELEQQISTNMSSSDSKGTIHNLVELNLDGRHISLR